MLQQETKESRRQPPVVPKDLPAFQLYAHMRHGRRKRRYDSVHSFLDDFEVTLGAYEMNIEDHWRRLIPTIVNPVRRAWLREIMAKPEVTSWNAFRREMHQFFTSPHLELYRRYRLRTMVQRPNEPLRAYATKFQEYALKSAIPNNQELAYNFLCSLNKRYRKTAWGLVHNQHGRDVPNELEPVVQLVLILESVNMSSDHSDDSSSDESDDDSDVSSNKGKRRRVQKSKGKKKAKKGMGCPLHPDSPHTRGDCTKLKHVLATEQRFMPSSQASSSYQGSNYARPYRPAPPRDPRLVHWCRYCKKVPYQRGHRCPEMTRTFDKGKAPAFRSRMAHTTLAKDLEEMMNIDEDELNKQSKGKQTYSRMANNTTSITHSIMVPITLQSKRIQALLDTGANRSLLDINFVTKNKWPIHKVPNAAPVILSVKDQMADQCGQVRDLQVAYMNRAYTHTFEVLHLSEDTKMTIGLDLMAKLGISIHGLVTTWDVDERKYPASNDTHDDVPSPNKPPAGTEQEQKAFHAAIRPFIHANANIPKHSFCTVPQSIVRLETPPGVTPYRPQYHLAEAAMPEVKKIIDKWLADGTIERAVSYSPGNSPLTLAPKKDATGKYVKLRLCLDPRHIHQLLSDNRFPLPLIKDIFHTLRGSQVFTTLDLKSAFHRFQIHPDDRHKLQFSILGQQYRWVGAPFGLKILPSIFQATMATLFHDLPYVQCFIVAFTATRYASFTEITTLRL